VDVTATGSIGAAYASALDTVDGTKIVRLDNQTNGDVMVAVNAILSAARPHRFLGISGDGQVSIVHSTGNPYGHLVLRGGDGRPNYDTVSVSLAEQAMKKANIKPNIVIDCSHANTGHGGDVLRAGKEVGLYLWRCVGFQLAHGGIDGDSGLASGRGSALEAKLTHPAPGRMIKRAVSLIAVAHPASSLATRTSTSA
jgi:hypothetical protein